jgi:hypothetical protein
MIQKAKDLIWVIEYGWYMVAYSFRIWSDIMGSQYNDIFYKNYTQQQIEEDYLFYFWESLDDGMDGWLDK